MARKKKVLSLLNMITPQLMAQHVNLMEGLVEKLKRKKKQKESK